jgi:hypothetical protein
MSHGARLLVLALACLLPCPASSHPGSGITVDRLGQVYFVDMVSGIWRLDARGDLTHMAGPAFHWMTLDASNRFGSVRLPSGTGGDFARIGTSPTLVLASDFPIAIGRDGNLYYPLRRTGAPLQISRFAPTGATSILGQLPGSVTDLKGLAAGSDGLLYYTEDSAIRRISKEGRVSTVVENVVLDGCRNPQLRGLEIDADGNVYVAATGCGNVLKVTPAGKVTALPQVRDPWTPTGVALLGKDVYVLEFQDADSDDRRAMVPRVRKITAAGTTAVIATVTRK